MIKFKFILKSGKTFECIEEISGDEFMKMVGVIGTSMREGVDGVVTFADCCVRLSECAVVEWEAME